MRFKLVIRNGWQVGSVVYVPEGRSITIGRVETCDLVLGDGRVSRAHCRIENDGKKMRVYDLHSMNGTYVNSMRIDVAELNPGDELRVGDTLMISEVARPTEAMSPPPRGAVAPSGLSPATTLPGENPKPGTYPKEEYAARTSGYQAVGYAPTSLARSAKEPEAENFLISHKFCEKCGRVIPRKEIAEGKVREQAGKFYCTRCDSEYIGRVIGQYKILEKIGEGTVGVVFRAEHVTVKRVAAMKVLFEQLTQNKVSVERFLREARAGAMLNHPNLVQIYDAGEDHGVYYIVMELVTGRSIDDIVREEGPLSVPRVLEIGMQICKALQFAHQKKVLHRDLRPGNVLLSSDGIAKVIDLGMAKSLERDDFQGLSTTGSGVVMPNYAAPELIFRQKDVDHRADLYSLGATLYFLLTGEPPYRANSPREFIEMISMQALLSPKEVNPDVPDELCQLIEKLMCKEPAERYQTPDEVITDLSHLHARFASGGSARELARGDLSAYDIKIAKEVQEKLIPSSLPPMAGYEMAMAWKPAKEIGGDYLDFVPLSERTRAAIIADVSGKGVPGAMVMVMVRSVIRMVAALRLSPRETLIKANRIICRDIRKGMFVSALYVLLDVKTHTATLASAGHNPPVLYRAKTGQAEFIEAGGMALGITKDSKFESAIREQTLVFEPGDSLLLYTDGVNEAKDPNGEEYGKEKMLAILSRTGCEPPQVSIDALVADIDKHRASASQSDDITIFGIKYLGEA